jgi:hypothetical protein
VVLVTTALVALGLGASPSAAASGRCAPGTGVTVVVDYGPLGGGTVIGCDPDGGGKPASEVVQGAGFSLQGVNNQPQFVCRVNGKPGTSGTWAEDCGDVPPADAYWGLFWSDADPASWVYSSEGVGSLEVPEGGSIGWRFQDGGARENPSAPPNPEKKSPSPQPTKSPTPQPSKPPKATSPTPTPTPSASVPPGTQGSSPAPEAAPDGPDERRPGGTGSGTAEDEKGDKGDKREEGADKGDRDKGAKDDRRKAEKDKGDQDAEPVAEPSESPVDASLQPASDEPLADEGSSAVLTLVAGGAVLLLVGAAGVIAWRRRV